VKNCYLNHGGQYVFHQPPSPPSATLQPHPNIMEFPKPLVQPVNDGWDKNPMHHPSGIIQWTVNPTLPSHHSVPFVTSPTSIARSPPKEHRVPSHEIQMDKGKRPISPPSTDTSQGSSVHSNQ
jgi:hypothetical protein